jgi:hypothetical protein
VEHRDTPSSDHFNEVEIRDLAIYEQLVGESAPLLRR